jgi:hypothetical protein
MITINRINDPKTISPSIFARPAIFIFKGKILTLQVSEKNNDLIINLQAPLNIDEIFYEQIPMTIIKNLSDIVPESIQVHIYVHSDIKGHSVVFENAKQHPFYEILKEKIVKKLLSIF